jgi:signal transduction histidine kinase
MSYVRAPDGARAPASPERVRVLLDAAVALTGEHDLEPLLERIVAGAAAVTGARFAALVVYGADGEPERFVHHGIDEETVELLGRPPRAVGVLRAAFAAREPIRLDDVTRDPRFCGFPPHHPAMQSFLGAPIGHGGRHFGNLYVAERSGGGSFDAEDEALVMSLAAFAACAIENTELLAAERSRAEALAQQARAEQSEQLRREMWAAVVAAQEFERARVARDLHDDIGQALTSVLLGLRLLNGAVDGANADQAMDDLRELVTDALWRTRELAFDLRPTVLDDVGLGPALTRLASSVADRSGLAVDALVDELPSRDELAPEIATVVYRVTQEALTNVVRHAAATHVSVIANVRGRRLRAIVEDDGVGFDPSAATSDLGMLGMRERAQLVGGTLQIVSSRGAGTSVVLEVPV